MGLVSDGDKVARFSEVRNAMRFPAIGQVTAYWEALRAGRAVPLRSEVDPRGIELALESAFILERVAPQVARFRLAGTALSDLMGMEVRGMPITAFFTTAAREDAGRRIEAVFQGPETAEFTLHAEAAPGKPALDARLVLLPLRSDLGDITRALGCLVADGPIGRAPRRFDLSEARMTKVEPGQPVRTTRTEIERVRGFAEPRGDFVPMRAPAAPPALRGMHLRLVKSDE